MVLPTVKVLLAHRAEGGGARSPIPRPGHSWENQWQGLETRGPASDPKSKVAGRHKSSGHRRTINGPWSCGGKVLLNNNN